MAEREQKERAPRGDRAERGRGAGFGRGRGRGRGRGGRAAGEDKQEWVPVTKLGRYVMMRCLCDATVLSRMVRFRDLSRSSCSLFPSRSHKLSITSFQLLRMKS